MLLDIVFRQWIIFSPLIVVSDFYFYFTVQRETAEKKQIAYHSAKFESTKEHFEGTPFSSLHPLLPVSKRGHYPYKDIVSVSISTKEEPCQGKFVSR